MAQRRMFTLKIVDSDAFLDMGQGAQLLYFHLAMRADDDGFVSNPKKIMRAIGAADDDVKTLLLKRFLIAFDNGIVVIKHWRMHNYIQNDRYTTTQYVEELKQLEVKENGAYTECIQDVSKVDTQVRLELGKDREGKDTDTSSRVDYFSQFWEIYPKKVGKGAAQSAWKKIKPSDELAKRIVSSVSEHLSDQLWKREHGRFIPNPATYLNQRRWEDEVTGSSSFISFA